MIINGPVIFSFVSAITVATAIADIINVYF